MGFTHVRVLRFAIFNLWFLSLSVTIIAFAYNMFALPLHTSSSEVIKSASIILGVVTPTLGSIAIFYYQLSPESERLMEARSPEFVYLAAAFSILYHAIFCGLVIAGVAFMALERDLDGDRLYRNCVVVVNVIGLLSVLLGPGAWLFASGVKRSP